MPDLNGDTANTLPNSATTNTPPNSVRMPIGQQILFDKLMSPDGFLSRHPLLASRIFPEAMSERYRAAHDAADLDLRKQEIALRVKAAEKAQSEEARLVQKGQDEHQEAIEKRKETALKVLGAGGSTSAKDTIELLKSNPNVDVAAAQPGFTAEAATGFGAPALKPQAPQQTGFGVPAGIANPDNPAGPETPFSTQIPAKQETLTYRGSPEEQILNQAKAKWDAIRNDPKVSTLDKVTAAKNAGINITGEEAGQVKPATQANDMFNPKTHNAVVFQDGKYLDSITGDVVSQPSKTPPARDPLSEALARVALASAQANIDAKNLSKTNAAAIYQGIKTGDIPPDSAGLARSGIWGEISALAAKDHFNLASAEKTWKAAVKLGNTLNSTTSVRLDTAVRSGLKMYDAVDELSNQWNGLGLGVLSRANLKLATEGTLGSQAQKLAVALNGQIAQLTSDIATVEQNGNTPTIESRKVAEQSMQSWWGNDTIHNMTNQGRANMLIHENARDSTRVLVPGTGPKEPLSKVQKNTNTGETRTVYSYDGGTTWGAKQ